MIRLYFYVFMVFIFIISYMELLLFLIFNHNRDIYVIFNFNGYEFLKQNVNLVCMCIFLKIRVLSEDLSNVISCVIKYFLRILSYEINHFQLLYLIFFFNLSYSIISSSYLFHYLLIDKTIDMLFFSQIIIYNYMIQ